MPKSHPPTGNASALGIFGHRLIGEGGGLPKSSMKDLAGGVFNGYISVAGRELSITFALIELHEVTATPNNGLHIAPNRLPVKGLQGLGHRNTGSYVELIGNGIFTESFATFESSHGPRYVTAGDSDAEVRGGKGPLAGAWHP